MRVFRLAQVALHEGMRGRDSSIFSISCSLALGSTIADRPLADKPSFFAEPLRV